MSRQPRDQGDGDPCPHDVAHPDEPPHGRMYVMQATHRQWCPSARHRGVAFYEWDGVTPIPAVGADTLAADLHQKARAA